MQAIQISIPEPCHESWQLMTPTEKGRFCSACAKEVIDFSKMTDDEVLNYFTKKTTADVCGRVLPGQLNRNIAKPVTIAQKVTWYWKYLVAAVLLFTKVPAKAQNSKVGEISTTPTNQQTCNTTRGTIAVKPAVKDTAVNEIYKGKIVDANGKGIPGATIKKLTETGVGVITDTAGNFIIAINKNSIPVVEISHKSFMPKRVTFSSIDNNIIQLNEMQHLLGMVSGINITTEKKPDDNFPKRNIIDFL
ncbi:MAG: hypothetical protein IPJ81_08070 [Chitinophagaceae bacterium]|nr:hypothetical protein [Chitinophagaceae bacterium]